MSLEMIIFLDRYSKEMKRHVDGRPKYTSRGESNLWNCLQASNDHRANDISTNDTLRAIRDSNSEDKDR